VLKSHAISPAARTRALRYLARIEPGVETLSSERYLLALLRLAAIADNGHDTVDTPDEAWWPTARLPLRMIWFPDGWVVARAAPAFADLVGARVVSIEHRSPAAMFARLRDLWGGPDDSRRWNLEFVVENAGLLYALGLAKSPDRLRLRLRLADGSGAERAVPFVRRDSVPAGQWLERVWSPAPWPGEAEQHWKVWDPQPTPLYLEDGDRLFRVVHLPELDALFLQMRVHFDGRDETVANFCRAVDDAIDTHRPQHLIVDLRLDTGGNIDLTRDWQRRLVSRVPGRVYVLVGPYTFSAGIVSAAAFKHDAGDRARIVGAALGDRLRWWSESTKACLPNSHYCLRATTGLWDLVAGCAAESDCYGDKFDVRVVSLEPQLHAPITAAAWLSGRDPGMEAIAKELGQQGLAPAGR
jgi:hypothetical protein